MLERAPCMYPCTGDGVLKFDNHMHATCVRARAWCVLKPLHLHKPNYTMKSLHLCFNIFEHAHCMHPCTDGGMLKSYNHIQAACVRARAVCVQTITPAHYKLHTGIIR